MVYVGKIGDKPVIRITLPKELVRVLNIEPGDYIYIKVQIAKKGPGMKYEDRN
jgi:bifunctional DNA-binding transcriptional regulator/antitoxin component of YhaV-PrlF toxin-antitoxin module